VLLLAACGQNSDRLTDEQALADAPDVPVNVPDEAVEEAPPVIPAASSAVLYRAVGNEPGWGLLVRADGMLYQGRYGEVRIAEASPPGFRPAPGTYRSGRLSITIAGGPCSDGMSGKAYRDKVTVVAGGDTVRGCGGGEIEVNSIEGTSWSVTAINGRPTGGGASYQLALDRGVISGRLGCNSLEGSFSRNGDHLAVEQLVGTQMACPPPAGDFEREGFAVLGSNMRMERVEGRLRLVSEAGLIELSPATREGT
jgi:heat shock protein HslJ